MMRCPEVKSHLALHSRGDLDARTAEAVGEHLGSCPACAMELSEYKQVTSDVRRAFETGISLPSAVRARIARTAAERASRHPWWGRLLPLPGHPVLAATAPALLVLLVVALPVALRAPGEVEITGSPVRIDIQAEGGTVRLAWSDGRGAPYRVYKSTNPRDLGTGQGKEVRGNEWVDSEPDTAPIVFYRVE